MGLSSYKVYSKNILNFQASTTILNACTKKSGNLLNAPHMIWFGWVLCHINHCRLFNPKSSLYIYTKYVQFSLVGFMSYQPLQFI